METNSIIELAKYVLQCIGDKLAQLAIVACQAAKKFFEYKQQKQISDDIKQQKKEKQQFEDKVDKVTTKGTIEDLLDLTR